MLNELEKTKEIIRHIQQLKIHLVWIEEHRATFEVSGDVEELDSIACSTKKSMKHIKQLYKLLNINEDGKATNLTSWSL